MRRKEWLVLAGIAILVLLLRFSTFYRSVLDWDESLFLLMGRSLLRGEAPYSTIWEHSPLGAAMLFALAQVVFGKSVLAIRILTWLAVTATAFVLYRLGNLLSRPGASAGWIAGVSYAVLSLNNEGLAAHRELLFAPFMALALYLILSSRVASATPGFRSEVRFLLAGLLLGFGLQLKYVYVLDVAAVGLIAAFSLWPARSKAFAVRTLKCWALLAVGPLFFFAVTAGYTALRGHFSDYLLSNFIAGVTYAGSEKLSLGLLKQRLVSQVTGQTLLWLSLALTPVYLFRARDVGRAERRNFGLLVIWFAAGFLGILISGRLWGHYFLQLLAPLSLLAALLITGALRPGAGWDPVRRNIVLILVVVAPLFPIGYPPMAANIGLMYRHFVRGAALPVDGPAQVAAYLRAHMSPDDALYVLDYEPILYYLVDARMPTRYVFPPHLIDVQFQSVDRTRPLEELDRIMAQTPRYVVRAAPPDPTLTNVAFAEAAQRYLTERYTLEKMFQTTATFGNRPIAVKLYRSK